MLDVHPPHEAAHTWKDFFIHIATIVVGLLIAIGLEQTVEAVHRHIERREVVESLMTEAEINLDATARDFSAFSQGRHWADASLASMLHATPGAPLILPSYPAPDEKVGAKVAWQSALSSGQVNLLDRTMRTRFSLVYDFYENSFATPDGSIARLVQIDYRLDTLLKSARRPDGSFDLSSADTEQRKRITDLLIEEDALLLSSMRQMMYLDAFSTAIRKAARDDDQTYFGVFADRLNELQHEYPEMHVSLYTEPGAP